MECRKQKCVFTPAVLRGVHNYEVVNWRRYIVIYLREGFRCFSSHVIAWNKIQGLLCDDFTLVRVYIKIRFEIVAFYI